MKTIRQYIAEDGTDFGDDYSACKEYEQNLKIQVAGLSEFTRQELTIGKGVAVVNHLPFDAPWMGPFGSCLVRIFEVERKEEGVRFGTGNEELPILFWLKADAFETEWSK